MQQNIDNTASTDMGPDPIVRSGIVHVSSVHPQYMEWVGEEGQKLALSVGRKRRRRLHHFVRCHIKRLPASLVIDLVETARGYNVYVRDADQNTLHVIR